MHEYVFPKYDRLKGKYAYVCPNVELFLCRKQRFRVTDKFYKPGGPAFLMIGGEGPANAAWMVAGTWLKAIAKNYETKSHFNNGRI